MLNVFKNAQRFCNVSEICLKDMFKKYVSKICFKCFIIMIRDAEFFRLRGGSISHTLKTPAIDPRLEYLWYKGLDEFRILNMYNP